MWCSTRFPPLIRANDSVTEGKAEQAVELLRPFFPQLPTVIEDGGNARSEPWWRCPASR